MLADSFLSLVDRIPTNFHSWMFCGLFFPALALCVGEPSMGLRHTPNRGPLQMRSPSGLSMAAHGCRASFFHVSVLPASLNVASVNPWLKDLCSLVIFSGRLFYNLIVIPVRTGEDVSVIFTYSTTILDPPRKSSLTVFSVKKSGFRSPFRACKPRASTPALHNHLHTSHM